MYPNVLCLAMHNDDDKFSKALKSGADGYLLKNMPLEKMLEGVYELLMRPLVSDTADAAACI